VYNLPPEELAKASSVPGSLEEVFNALEADCDSLLADDVFTADAIETHLKYKREREVHEIRRRLHPYEFVLYYDV
jgi:glutamine synthetase